MNELLEEHGKQLLRYKGVLNIAGEDRRLVFQGVLSCTASTGMPSGPKARRGKA
jgi:G3E family GTPase